MSDIVLYSIITVSAIGVIAALILFIAAQKFKVIEDPRIDDVEEALPGANCGGCGVPGCRPFAEACVKADTFESLFCPVGGNDCMVEVAKILGKTAIEKDPEVAVIACNGCPEHRSRTNEYDGATNCRVASNLYGGDTACSYGCLGLGDCVDVCNFDAIYIDEKTKLPVVSDDKCTACNACVEICPKNIIELRKKNKKDRKIFVSCVNEDKGGSAKKSCSVACIACGKCVKECAFDAIIVENNLAYIDPIKCKLCRKCVSVCPTNSIIEIGFPPKKIKAPKEDKPTIKKEKVNKVVAKIEKETEVISTKKNPPVKE